MRRSKASLLRFVSDDAGRVSFDGEGTKEGRGVYVCVNAHCLDQAVLRGAFARSLRRRVCGLDAAELKQCVVEMLSIMERYWKLQREKLQQQSETLERRLSQLRWKIDQLQCV